MWIIIIGFVVFVGILCVVAVCQESKKDAEKAAAKAWIQARREKIATSPNVTTIAQAIVSRGGFPQKIEIQYNGIYIKKQMHMTG